ncbi:MAG: putative Ig domain-containing protein [Cellvibrio sp.]|uniref:putative Ig domain-containing protein n=1 Tax=Cellvibrio sp. TaxID=1965322 RepID=UPI0031A6A21D
MSRSPRHRRPLIEALEPRLLFSATADIAVFDDGNSDVAHLAQAAQEVDLVSIYMADEPSMMDSQSFDADAQADIPFNETAAVKSVVFVDTSVAGYDALVEDIRDRFDENAVAIIYLDSAKNGVEQITTALGQYAGLDSIHIISHGSAGAVELGNAILTDNSLVQYEDDLVAWGRALGADADILFYGCDVAINPAGQALIEKIARLTDADVAASSDVTGHDSLGGDWDLEYQVGDIESGVLISAEAQQSFVGVMATTHFINIQGGSSSQPFSGASNIGQTFQYDSSGPTYTINQISVQLKKDPTAANQTITLELREGGYNGTWLANASINVSAIGTDFEWKTFSLGNIALNDNQTYCIRLISTSADGKVSAAYSASNIWNNAELIVNGVANSSADMSLLVSYFDGTNSVPTVANPIPNQSTNEEAWYSYTFPANTFADADFPTTLTYTATLSDGSPLPPWLGFNATTRTFSGMPDDGDVGTLSIRVTASDGAGGSVNDTFDLVINNVNDLPFVNIPIPNQNATEDSVFSYTFPANTFGDGDVGVVFTYTAELASGGSLPSWLHFDSATRTFSGTPLNGDVGTISVKVIANDGGGATVSDNFDIVIANTNDAPTVANQIPNQTATENVLFNYTFPINTFNDQDVGNTLTYTAQIPGGTPLPAWLTFDSATRTLSGTPSNGDVGNITIEIIASDGTATVSDFFDIDVQNVGSSNVIYETSGPSTDTQVIASGVPFFQSFSHNSIGSTYTIDSIVLQLVKDPSAALQTITVTLLSGAYNGTVVGSATVSSATIGTTLAWKAFDFTNVVLTDNQLYFIRIESSSVDGQVKAAIHNTDVYANGSYHSSFGSADITRDVAFQIASGANVDPVVVTPISNQTATEDSAYTFQFNSNTFNDADVGDVLTYTATMADGSALPSWLSFNAATRTFSGTPTNADVGTISIKVTADDGNGGTPASDTFDLTVLNTNDAPTVANPIPNQNATEDSAFNFTFASNTFTDQDVGNTLTYTAQLAGGGALPSWISFDPATRTFSGTPLNAHVGTLSIDVIANDGNGGTVTDTFNIVIANTNDAPIVANTIPNQNATEDSIFIFQFAGNTFSDPDVGDILTYSAQLNGGGALPSWLLFNPGNRTFSGLPANEDVDSFAVDVIASDGNGGIVIETFTITVTNVNDAPEVSIPLTDYYTDEQVTVNLHGTGIAITDIDSNSVTLTISASWLGSELNANVGTTGVVIFSGNDSPVLVLTGTLAQINDFLAGNNGGTLTYELPVDNPPATVNLTFTASDGALTGSDTTTVNITAVNDAPVNAVPGAQITTEDTALVFSAGNSNQIQISDVDAGSGNLEVTLSVTNGTLTLAGITGLSFTTGDGTADSTLVFTGTLANINTALATLTFNPTLNYNGAAVLSITTSDLGNTGSGGTLTDTDTVNITVNASNDAPNVANPISNQNATEDSAFNFQFANNTFADVDGDALTYSVQLNGGGPLPSWLTFNAATRTFSGTPANADVGTISIDVIADDGNGGTITDTFNIVIANTNDAPTIANPIPDANATQGAAFNFQFAANTFNDIDVGDTLTYSVQLAGGGALPSWLTFNAATRTFSGTPANADVGTLSIDVIASDGNGGTVTDTFDIVIANTNDAPTVANPIPNQNATEDSAFNFQFANNTFSDVDGDPLTYSVQLNGGGSLPSWLTFNAATRTFSGTPANADVGTLSIDVIADDGNGGTVTDTFNIVIANTNDAPTVANPLPDRVANENTLFNFQFAANTFNDVDAGDTLSYSAQLAGGGSLPSWLTFNAATRTFSGVPSATDTGTVNIDVIASDGNGGLVTDTFTITVAGAPDTEYIDTGNGGNFNPVSSANQVGQSFSFDSVGATYTVNEISLSLARYDAAALQTITVELRDSWNGAVIASASISSALISRDGFNWHSFSFGDVVLNDQQTYVIQISSTGTDDLVLVSRFSSNVFADGSLIENGVPHASGWDLSFKVSKDDGANSAPVADNPISNKTIDAELPFNFVMPANTFSDPDVNDTLMYRAQLAGGGSLGWLAFNEATRTFSGTPHWHQAGTITVELIATDNHGASTSTFFDIEVVNTNTAPTVANPIPDVVTNEDAAFNFQFAANTFGDVDGNSFTYSAELAVLGGLPPWLSFDSATRTFSGTPANGDVGTWTVEVTANDGFGGSAIDTFVITVANTNDAPTILNPLPDRAATQGSAFNFQFVANTFIDQDVGDVFTYTAQLNGGGTLPTWLSFDSATRTFSGTPGNSDVGTITIEVIADDGNGGTVSDTFDLVVNNINDAPTVANPITDQNATEDSAFNFQFAANTFDDVDIGSSLTYSAQLNGGAALPTWLIFDPATRTFSGTPVNADVGTINIDVIANDGLGGTVTDTFAIVIANTNDAPTLANPIPDQSATESLAFNFAFAANTFNDEDVGDVFIYSAQLAGGGALPTWLTFDAATRTFSGTPATANLGSISIEVIASDGNGGSITDTFTLVVNALPVNAPPVLQNAIADQVANEDSSFTYSFPANTFTDAEGDALSYSARMADGSAMPSWLSFDAASRTFSGTPANDDVGSLNIIVTASDGNGGSVSDTFIITVNNTNDAPVLVIPPANQTAEEDVPFTVTFPANMFTDVDAGTQLSYTAQLANGDPLPAWLVFDAATLTFSGTPSDGDDGTLSIQLIASDGIATATAQFQLAVAAVNDAPVTSGFAPIINVEDAMGDVVDLFSVFTDDSDAANQLQYSVVSNTNPGLVSGAVIDPVTGKLQLSYGANQFGNAELIIRAQDSEGALVETVLKITITPVNDTPTSIGIADVKVQVGAAAQQTNLHSVFSDIEDGTALRYSVVGNTNPAVATNILIDPVTGVMTLAFASISGGESVVTLRAVDAEGAWVETQFKVMVTARDTGINPEEPGKPPPVVPPVTPPVVPPTVPPVEIPGGENPTTPPVGGGSLIPPVQPGEALDPGLPGTGNPVAPDANDVDDPRKEFGFVDDKSSRDYERAKELLNSGNVPLSTLNASPALMSLITPDAGFAPWEAEDFDSEVRRIRAQMDEAMEEESNRKAVVAGITLSVTTGLLVWSLRASSLLLTMMSMLPLWRGLDPLPILDEVNKKKKELEQQRKDRESEDKSAKEVGYLFDHAQGKDSKS